MSDKPRYEGAEAHKAVEAALHNAVLAALDAERVVLDHESALSADFRFLEAVEDDLVRLQNRVDAYRKQLPAAHPWFKRTLCSQCGKEVERGYEQTHRTFAHKDGR